MTDTQHDEKPSPIEVWLSQPNMEVTCTIVREDESTDSRSVSSLSMRGAQREITGWLIRRGYVAVGRWEIHAQAGGDEGDPVETSRTFRLA